MFRYKFDTKNGPIIGETNDINTLLDIVHSISNKQFASIVDRFTAYANWGDVLTNNETYRIECYNENRTERQQAKDRQDALMKKITAVQNSIKIGNSFNGEIELYRNNKWRISVQRRVKSEKLELVVIYTLKNEENFRSEKIFHIKDKNAYLLEQERYKLPNGKILTIPNYIIKETDLILNRLNKYKINL